MSLTTFEQLLEAGVHFGHLTRKWNPAMAPYIFMERNGIHIIDLYKTIAKVDEAAAALKSIAKSGKKVLFVATKKQAKQVIADKASAINMPYVIERWPGGMLTNFPTIRKAVKKMTTIDKMSKDGTFDNLSKREKLQITRQRAKLEKNLGSIADLNRLPAALFVVDEGVEGFPEFAVLVAVEIAVAVAFRRPVAQLPGGIVDRGIVPRGIGREVGRPRIRRIARRAEFDAAFIHAPEELTYGHYARGAGIAHPQHRVYAIIVLNRPHLHGCARVEEDYYSIEVGLYMVEEVGFVPGEFEIVAVRRGGLLHGLAAERGEHGAGKIPALAADTGDDDYCGVVVTGV